MSSLFKNYSLVEDIYLENTERNCVNEQNAHATNRGER